MLHAMHTLLRSVKCVSAAVGILSGSMIGAAFADEPASVVYAWGLNNSGQLGPSTSQFLSSVPVQVSGVMDVKAVEGGAEASLSLLDDGTVWQWGRTPGPRDPVRQVPELTDIKGIAGYSIGLVALKSDGTVWEWRGMPYRVWGLTDVAVIEGNYNHILAIRIDGTIWAWGNNDYGQLGYGVLTRSSSKPRPVAGVTDGTVRSAAAGGTHSLAVLSDGTVRAWGDNRFGQLGDGTTVHQYSAVAVSGLTDVVSVAAGGWYSLAVLSDGTVRAWGDNRSGQLGDGTSGLWNFRTSPAVVPGLTDIVDVETLAASSFALSADGRVWAWGDNEYGQLGLGDNVDRLSPTEVVSPRPGYRFAAIAGGLAHPDGGHMLAILEPIPEPCAADFNGDNARDVADLFAYINAWLAKDPAADLNEDAGVDAVDLFEFINAWLAGC